MFDLPDRSVQRALELKLYSTMPPPEDNLALEKLLESMMPSKRRFVNTTTVKFKNYMFSDEAVNLATQLFPFLGRLDLDGARITNDVFRNLSNFRNLSFLSINCSNIPDIEDKHVQPLLPRLERLFVQAGRTTPNLALLKSCHNCKGFYNIGKNSSTSCLYHPGEYSGYGHSCSSFSCCGSNTPSYSGTPGCQYGSHLPMKETAKHRCVGRNENWLPEYEDVPYKFFRARRRGDSGKDDEENFKNGKKDRKKPRLLLK